MATLLECIAVFEARRTAVEPTAAITPRGEVVATIQRLADLLSTLDEADLAFVRPMLAEFVTVCDGSMCGALAARTLEPPIVGRCKVWFVTRSIGAPNIDVWVVRDESGRHIEYFEAEGESVEASEAAADVAQAFCDEMNARLVTA